MVGKIIALVVLIMFSAFFSASETALTSVNKIRLKYKADNGSAKAKRSLKLVEQYDKALSTILIGNNIVNISASSLATLLVMDILPESWMKYSAVISTVALTLIVITFGEILPKSVARLNAENITMSFCGVLRLFIVLFTPLTAFFGMLQSATGKLFKIENAVSVTEEELIQIIEDIEDEGVLEEQESSLVRQALIFDETTVEEVLTPRVNVMAVAVNEDKEKIKSLFLTEGYSRLPVYEKSIDHVCGVLNIKDFMRKMTEEGDNFDLCTVTQDALFIPALMKLSNAMKLMQKQKLHMAIVVDQYGGTEGIVTLEDVLEELVGEIFDEGDEVVDPVVFTSDVTFEVSGNFSKNDFNRYFEKREMDFEITAESNTVGGWVFELFGKIPEENDSVVTDDFKITVLNINGRVIEKLCFEILKPSGRTDD